MSGRSAGIVEGGLDLSSLEELDSLKLLNVDLESPLCFASLRTISTSVTIEGCSFAAKACPGGGAFPSAASAPSLSIFLTDTIFLGAALEIPFPVLDAFEMTNVGGRQPLLPNLHTLKTLAVTSSPNANPLIGFSSLLTVQGTFSLLRNPVLSSTNLCALKQVETFDIRCTCTSYLQDINCGSFIFFFDQTTLC